MGHYDEDYTRQSLKYRTPEGLYDMKEAMSQRKKGDITASDVQRMVRENTLIQQMGFDKMMQEGMKAMELGTTSDRNKPTESLDDAVSSPNHYLKLGYECIEIIASSLSKEAFKGYCMGNFLKYRFRMGNKGDMLQDFNKSKEYLMLYDKYSHLCKDVPF
tara:strand:+ start:726 stop:1205 length:480 start_codon:yes stop_codon:yes gene_type:complete